MPLINPIDRDALREQVRRAQPFKHFKIDNFLEASAARQIAAAFPTYEEMMAKGRSFKSVNEKGKVQLTDSSQYPEPLQLLNRELASGEFLGTLSYVMEMPGLLADDQLVGGGLHATGPRGRLDVHVDFNYIPERQLHRRLNIILFFNEGWREEWGGKLELWDKDVQNCEHAFVPLLNRCVVFHTNDISYHGVTGVTSPEGVVRKSFAAYYYTKEAPPEWTGEAHSTIFKPRPDEVVKGKVLMPLEKLGRRVRQGVRDMKQKIK